MMMLSSVIAHAYCPASNPAWPDHFFSVGCQSVGNPLMPRDARDAAWIGAQTRDVERTGHAPWDPDQELDGVFNDLFSPYRNDESGRLTVWIPIPIEEAVSSTLIPQDWRFVALAWWAVRRVNADPSRRVAVVAFDSAGRTVAADMQVADLYEAMAAALRIKSDAMVAGPACRSCSMASGCPSLLQYIDALGAPPDAPDDGTRPLRLYNERASVGIRLEMLEKRRDEIDAELVKLLKDGRLKLAPDYSLEVPARTSTAWEFGIVRRVLMAHGIWDDSYGSVRAGELQKALARFPAKVRSDLEKAKTDKVGTPSLSEAIRHGSYATRPPIFGAVAGR